MGKHQVTNRRRHGVGGLGGRPSKTCPVLLFYLLDSCVFCLLIAVLLLGEIDTVITVRNPALRCRTHWES